jgi:hypothetical protein
LVLTGATDIGDVPTGDGPDYILDDVSQLIPTSGF